ncbi:vascular cell adhesion protein 1-like [Fundulus diaphanus]
MKEDYVSLMSENVLRVNMLLSVFFLPDAPKDTSASISPSGLASAGSWVELSCSSRAKPPASFTWFRNSKHGAINVSVGQVYSFNATEGGEYYFLQVKEDYVSLMAALSEKMLAVNMLLSVFFLPGVLGDCGSRTPILFLTIPNKIEALIGSCLLVPCSFRAEKGDSEFNSEKETRGAWIQSKNYIYDINQGVTTDLVKITGNLRQKNCTTVFSDINKSQEDKYFLRIENGGYKATACSSPLHITVQDSPWSPSINISAADLKENQSVTISCSALTPCPHSPPELTWSLQQDSHRQTEKNTEGTFTTKIQETITLSDTHDGYNISCSATYPVNGGNKTAETEVTLSVSYAPKDTSASISPSGLVSAGSWVELSCSSRAKPPASFTWFRNSTDGAINVSVGQVYSFRVTEGGEYYCEATNDLGQNGSSVIFVTIEAYLCTDLELDLDLALDFPSDLPRTSDLALTPDWTSEHETWISPQNPLPAVPNGSEHRLVPRATSGCQVPEIDVEEVYPDLARVPSYYHDLKEVFNKSKATALPPHRPFDCTFDTINPDILHQNRMQIFSDDNTVIGLIQGSDESAHKQEGDWLFHWCCLNDLKLNLFKKVEMTVDFQRTPSTPPPKPSSATLCLPLITSSS